MENTSSITPDQQFVELGLEIRESLISDAVAAASLTLQYLGEDDINIFFKELNKNLKNRFARVKETKKLRDVPQGMYTGTW